VSLGRLASALVEGGQAFRRDLDVVRKRNRRARSRAPLLAACTDMGALALGLLRTSIVLRRATGHSWGTRGLLRWVFHIDVWTDEIGSGLALPHPFNIVIGSGVSLGADCTLMHNTTVQNAQCTQIGDRVVLGTGCVVLADRRIGSDAMCGANSVVTRDVPERAVVVGAPAHVVRFVGEEGRRAA
jgi:serine acetyltransferase